MFDIFISYSRKDSEQALQLVERLQGEGMSVWIDQRGIEAATTWSEEIVNAIEGSKAFIVLLSSHSVESGNVAKELSLAYESERPLIPVMLEDVPLTPKFKYPLAGVQRVAYTQFDAIGTALYRCGVTALKPVKKSDGRKSLLVMPFEDLSPTQDNIWFADGLAGELIDKLSHIKSLRLIDRKTSRDLRTSKLSVYDIASTLDVQYIIEGSVRKFGEQIKISTSLLDVKEGDQLWQRSHKGTMDDVFELQEQCAESVVEALQLELGAQERASLVDRGTTNHEAYELYLKGREFGQHSTREGLQHAVQLHSLALELDPNFVDAMNKKSRALASLYSYYDRDPSQVEEAEALDKRALEIRPDDLETLGSLSYLYTMAGRYDDAEEVGLRSIQLAPQHARSHFTLARFYFERGNDQRAITHYEDGLAIEASNEEALMNIVLASDRSGDKERTLKWSRIAAPIVELRLRLHPDQENPRLTLAILLHCAGASMEKISGVLEPLLTKSTLDGHTLYNLACLLTRMGEIDQGMETLMRAHDRGYLREEHLSDRDLDGLRSLPQFLTLAETINSASSATTA